MCERVVADAAAGRLDAALLARWLRGDALQECEGDALQWCEREEFAAHFLAYLRAQTDSVVLGTGAGRLLGARQHHRSVSDPTSRPERASEARLSHASPRRLAPTLTPPPAPAPAPAPVRERRNRNKLHVEERTRESLSSDESRVSAALEEVSLSPTAPGEWPESPSSPAGAGAGARRHKERTCLGDYIQLATPPRSSRKKRSSRAASEESSPRLLTPVTTAPSGGGGGWGGGSGGRKAERRRITPTTITAITPGRKSLSLSSFPTAPAGGAGGPGSPSALGVSQSSVFRSSAPVSPALCAADADADGFAAERSALRRERRRLLDKFNALHAPTPASPQHALRPPALSASDGRAADASGADADADAGAVGADASRAQHREHVDALATLYATIVDMNVSCSVESELVWLLALLEARQGAAECAGAERALGHTGEGGGGEEVARWALRTVHNAALFAVRALWALRDALLTLLERGSLKLVGEHRVVRAFSPDLAKLLLNEYGLRAEAGEGPGATSAGGAGAGGVVYFNLETDNAENFPSALSFQNFKKQRDMYYELYRWYGAAVGGGEGVSVGGAGGGSRTAFRARVKALVGGGGAAANHYHLAALFTQHMLAECLPRADQQESRLSKLQRRLTSRAPSAGAGAASPAVAHFAPHEMFYKEVLVCAEGEGWRAHVRDALAAELVALDAAPIALHCVVDARAQYVCVVRRARLFAKFLGLLAALPYAGGGGSALPLGAPDTPAPPTRHHQRVLDASVALREHSQPSLDVLGMLRRASLCARLAVTLPWVASYLAQLDAGSLRTRYYTRLLRALHTLYRARLAPGAGAPPHARTRHVLRCVLGGVLALPHCAPRDHQVVGWGEGGGGEAVVAPGTDTGVALDVVDLVSEALLAELCPALREAAALLRAGGGAGGRARGGSSHRHITPLSLAPDPEELVRNKERELQARLEEQFVASQPASTRRVLELVTERVTSQCVRELAAPLESARRAVRLRAAQTLRHHTGDLGALLPSLEALYAAQLAELRANALSGSGIAVRARCPAALHALLPAAPAPQHLAAVAVRAANKRLNKWLNDNWTTTAVLCKDIEAEMRMLSGLEERASPSPASPAAPPLSPAPAAPPLSPAPAPDALLLPPERFHATHTSVAEAIIDLKEQVCAALEGEAGEGWERALSRAAAACAPTNLFCRAPAQRAAAQLSLELCLAYVCKRPEQVTDSFLEACRAVWCAGGAGSGEEALERAVCARNVSLVGTGATCWRAYTALLRFARARGDLRDDALTDQCVAVFQHEWPQSTLHHLSACMRAVSGGAPRSPGGPARSPGGGGGGDKLGLFLEFLAEYCHDLDEPA